jgi:hypothetical protein
MVYNMLIPHAFLPVEPLEGARAGLHEPGVSKIIYEPGGAWERMFWAWDSKKNFRARAGPWQKF